MTLKTFAFFILIFTLKFNCLFSLVDAISISGSPPTFVVNSAIAGQNPTAASNSSTTYTVETSLIGSKSIVGRVNANFPTGVFLTMNLVAVSGATSAGYVNLTTTNQTLETGISATFAVSAAINYILIVTPAASPATNVSRTITLTIQ